MRKPPLLVVTGPTASGKTRRAVEMARRLDGEIISADSRQVYEKMDIGTGKDLEEYGEIPFHLIDICPPGYKYNLYEYLRDFDKAFSDISDRGKFPILCGGTGLYVESVLNGLRLPDVPQDKQLRRSLKGKTLEELTGILASMKTLHNTTDLDTANRAIRAIEIQKYYLDHPDEAVRTTPEPIDALIIGIDIDSESRRKRKTQRIHHPLDKGLVEEVEGLLAAGISAEDLIYYGLEYKYVTRYLIGELNYSQMAKGLETAIHQFAKRQMTWFRGMERRGFKINWLPWDMDREQFVLRVLELMQARS